MLNNEQFFSSFVLTLYVIGAIAAFLGIALAIGPVWRFFLPFRERLWRSWVVCLIRAMGAILEIAMARIKGFVKNRLLVFAVLLRRACVSLWRVFVLFLALLAGLFQRAPNWVVGTGSAALVIGVVSVVSLVSIGVSWYSIIGIAAAGCLAGALCAPFVVLRYKSLRPGRAIGISLLTMAGGAWISMLLVAVIAVATTG